MSAAPDYQTVRGCLGQWSTEGSCAQSPKNYGANQRLKALFAPHGAHERETLKRQINSKFWDANSRTGQTPGQGVVILKLLGTMCIGHIPEILWERGKAW